MENNAENQDNALENNDNKEDSNKNSNVPSCCVGCVRWEKFGKNCWYYWEGKKHCTMWTGSWDEVMIQ